MKKSVLIVLSLMLGSAAVCSADSAPAAAQAPAAVNNAGNKGNIVSGSAASESKKYHNTISPDGTVQSQKVKGFWQREAERSGFAGTGAMISNGISGAIPLAKPNSGKKQS